MILKINRFGLFGFLCFLPLVAQAITMEVRRISDNSLATNVDFGSLAMATRGLANQYIVVRYEANEEDADTLKLFTDNENWQGAGAERGGLVRTPSYSERVPVFWKAYSDVQANVVFDAQTISSWSSLRDVNDDGFSTYTPSDVSVPLFPSGTTFIYFGADVGLGNGAAPYVASIKVKNGAVQGNALIIGEGFAPFNAVYKPKQEPNFQIPFGVKSNATVKLRVIDRQGKEVVTLVSGAYASGNHSLSWDGKDGSGNRVSSGVYMLILQIGSNTSKKKIAVIN